MKKQLLTLLLILLPIHLLAQQRKYSTFYEQRATLFEMLPITSEDIVFVGNSITNGGEWTELLENKNIKNRGISGDITEGVYDRLDAITKGQPKAIFLLIGINDISKSIAVDYIAKNIDKIVNKIKTDTPKTSIYLQSLLPVNPDKGMFGGHMKPDSIRSLNIQIKKIAERYKINFINLYPQFVIEGTEKLLPEYTNDGLHLLGAGYIRWAEIVKPYLND